MNDNTLQQNALVSLFGAQRRWVNWRLEEKNGKMTKVPYQTNGKQAASTRPHEWATYKEVKDNNEKVGIILNDGYLVCIDIDHVIKDGKLISENKEEIADLILELDTYVEISQSGTGLHIFFLTNTPITLVRHKQAPYEVYNTVRFIAITENVYGQQKEISTIDAITALSIIDKIIPQITHQTSNLPSSSVETLSDDEILAKMFSARNGAEMKALWGGDVTLYGEKGNDSSSGDVVLCGSLAFWSGRNAAQIERIWLASPLGKREKTQQRQDYRDRTVLAAINYCKEIYTPKIVRQEQITPSHLSEETIEEAPSLARRLDDLLTTEYPPARFALEPFFELNSLNMVSAPPNSWKSWTLFEMAIAISKGESFLGNFATEKANVLIVNEEDTERLIADRFKALNAPKGLGIFFRIAEGSKLTNEYCENLLQMCLKEDIKVVMFDSLRAMTLAEENSSKEMQEVMDAMKILIRGGMTVIFTHHHKKKGPNGVGDHAESSRGSSAINAAVSGHISLEEVTKDGETTIVIRHLKSKVTQKIAPINVMITRDGKNVSFSYGGGHDDTQRGVAKAQEAICDFLDLDENKERWVSRREIKDSGIANANYIDNACGALFNQGLIQKATKSDLVHNFPELKDKLNGAMNSVFYRIVSVAEEASLNGVMERAKQSGRLISKDTRNEDDDDTL